MASVKLHPDRQTLKDIDIAIRRFKQAVDRDGTLDDIRNNQAYAKPSEQKKLKSAAAKARWKRTLKRHQLPDKLF